MDFARETQLIHTIDHDVQRLLTHVDELSSAGDDRPLLTAVGRTLQQHLHQAAEVIGALAALLPEASAGAPPIERKRVARIGKPRGKRLVHAIASAPSATANPEPTANAVPTAPVLRPKRRRPAPSPQPVDGARDGDPAVDSPDEAGAAPADSTPATAPTLVYRLRKAGTKEPQPGPAVRERDELRRLSGFLQGSAGADPALASAS